jgi:tetratricopeptide (TPR) repeat protein/tRNA A-37 threonylcarbamoyl transferase component Bud32
MGEVVLAHDKHLDRRVAVKILQAELSAAIDSERFAREVRVTARLVHPNIVPLFDSGVANGCLYYVMPFVDGATLRARLNLSGRLPVDEALGIVRDIAEALAYAHGQGIVHRDIKPENIFCYGGRALLADFGIAKNTAQGSTGSNMTDAGVIIGTLAYMSPEQLRGETAIDGRSDLYSLGCVLFEMLSGKAPFSADSAIAFVARRLTAPVPDLAKLMPDLPPSLTALTASLLADTPEQRPSSAGALLESIRNPLRQYAATHDSPTVVAPASPSQKVDAAINAESLAAYRDGRAQWARGMQGGAGTKDKLEMALAYFMRARQLDARNVMAIAGQADCIHVLGYRGFRPFAEASEQARALRMEALAIDDQVAELHAGIGVTLLYWDDDFMGAGSALRRALDLDPQSINALRFYGTWLKIAGRAEEGVEYVRAAVTITPDAAAYRNELGDILIAVGRHDEAIEHLRIALGQNPKYEVALERLELASHRSGRPEDAQNSRRAVLGQRGLTDRLASLDDNIVKFGWGAARELDVRSELASLLEQATRDDPFIEHGTSRQVADQIIVCYAELGEWRSAMDWVERGYHKRPGRLRRVLTDFLFDRRGLAVDPRYAPLLRNAGLGELL